MCEEKYKKLSLSDWLIWKRTKIFKVFVNCICWVKWREFRNNFISKWNFWLVISILIFSLLSYWFKLRLSKKKLVNNRCQLWSVVWNKVFKYFSAHLRALDWRLDYNSIRYISFDCSSTWSWLFLSSHLIAVKHLPNRASTRFLFSLFVHHYFFLLKTFSL